MKESAALAQSGDWTDTSPEEAEEVVAREAVSSSAATPGMMNRFMKFSFRKRVNGEPSGSRGSESICARDARK
jgi:hypothetical protein